MDDEDYESWHELIENEMKCQGESWADVVSIAPADLDLHRRFDSGYGGEQGQPFTVWTERRVYFPACYDGSEWCASVVRNPDGKPTNHIGGG